MLRSDDLLPQTLLALRLRGLQKFRPLIED
jgi:hypothetical protein